jgi:hypothetical protein
MTFDKYVSDLPQELSEVKYAILKTLWGSGGGFPRPWVKSSTLLNLTNQKYFDRRVRELQDEIGCDIENGHNGGEHSYRLLSDKLKKANPRLYLSAAEKRALFTKHHNTCQVCGKTVQPGVRGLQADHKIPLMRGGSHEQNNWQPLCNACNVAKRRSCADCNDDCQKCPWAVPEKIGMRTLVTVPQQLLQEMRKRGLVGQADVEGLIVTAISEHLKRK